jgi:hypothetical protein
MTNEPSIQRRSLLKAVQPHQPRDMSEAEIAAVASRNGFESSPVANEEIVSTPRRNRQLMGRDHQFHTRLRKTTLDFIYTQANSRNIPIAQVIEEMADALKRQQGSA